MGKGLINTTVSDATGKASVHYDGRNIDQLDIIIEDKFFDGKYGSLDGIPETFTPDRHQHAIDDIVAINESDGTEITFEDKIDIKIDDILDTFCQSFCDNLGQCEKKEDDNDGN